MDFLYSLFDLFSSLAKNQELRTSLAVFKVLFIIVAAAFFILIIWFYLRAGFFAQKQLYYSYFFNKKKKPEPGSSLPLKELNDYWQQLVARLGYQDEAQWKLAVIEFDNFFDHVLTLLGYQGESLGERLQKILPEHLASINDVWRVHKLRNALVHDAAFQLSHNQAKDVIGTYERALKELKILE